MRSKTTYMTRDELIALAAESEIELDPEDIDGREPGPLFISGAPAEQWLAEMTMW